MLCVVTCLRVAPGLTDSSVLLQTKALKGNVLNRDMVFEQAQRVVPQVIIPALQQKLDENITQEERVKWEKRLQLYQGFTPSKRWLDGFMHRTNVKR